MGRLMFLFIAVVAVIVVMVSLGRVLGSVSKHTQEASVPDTAKTISYVLLIVLMFGVVTGWLGGL